MKNAVLALLSLLLVPLVVQESRAQTFPLPDLMPRDLEAELALSALPEHLRGGAAVYALERGGYVAARTGTNGFHCLVRRMGAVPGYFVDSVVPVCYDREGSTTLLPAVLEEVRLLEAGKSAEVVAEQIAAHWREGTFQEPGAGVAYMLSPVFRIVNRQGRVLRYVPHLMFYGPGKQNTDVGSNGDRFGYVPFIQAPGLPSAMMVVPVGEAERQAILEAGQALQARVDAFLANAQ